MDSQSREAVVLHSRGLHGRLHAVQVFLVYTQECIREQLTGLIPADRASFVSCISQGSENPPTAKTDWILDIMHSLFEGVGEERTQFLRSAIEWIDLGISGDVLMDNARTYVAAAVGRLRAKEQSVLIENELVRWERDPWALVPNRVASVDLVALTSRFGVCAPRTRLGMAARIASARTEEAIRLTIDWLVSFCWKDLVDLARLFATGEVVEAREHSWFVALVRRLAVERTNAAMGLLRARRAFVAMDIPLIDDALARSVVMDLTESLRALPSAPELIGGELTRWQTNPFLVSWGAKDSVEVLRACLSREEGILVRQWGQSVAVQIRDAAALCAREAIAVQSDDVVNEAFWFPVERFTLAAVSFVEPGLVAAVRFIEEKSLPLSADPGFAYVRRAAFTPSGTDDEKSGRHADEIELRTLLHDRDYETMLGERGVCPPASFLAGGDAVSLSPGPSITGTEAKVAFTSDGRFVVKTLLVAGRNSMSKRLFGALSRERGVHETIGDLGGLSVGIHRIDAGVSPACGAVMAVFDFGGAYTLAALRGRLSELQISQLAVRIISMLHAVHAYGIVHGDIHWKNFVLSDPADPVLSPWELRNSAPSRRVDMYRLSEMLLQLARSDIFEITDAAKMIEFKMQSTGGPELLERFHLEMAKLDFTDRPQYEEWIRLFREMTTPSHVTF